MAKSSPEKLAAALRANLKRRKEAHPPKASKTIPKPGSETSAEAPKSPSKRP
jgi:hypothetical protein